MSRKLRIAFAGSILANVLLAGVLLGELPHRFGRGYLREQRMEKVLQSLPAPVQSRFRDKLARDERSRGEFAQARESIMHILVTEPLDEAAYDREVSRVEELRNQRSREMTELVKEAARDLPLEQRKALAEFLTRGPPPPPPTRTVRP